MSIIFLREKKDRPATGCEPFLQTPLPYLATRLYQLRSQVYNVVQHSSDSITIVCISDTHNTQPELADGDLLLHAGDLTENGTFDELQNTLEYLNSQPHRYKVAIAGNHDWLLDAKTSHVKETPGKSRSDLRWGNVIYLQDSSTTLDFGTRKLIIYGSPLTHKWGNWAFQFSKPENVWRNRIPEDTDILLTHGPPKYHLDDRGFGNDWLLKELWRARPSLVVFGHVHEGHGLEHARFDRVQKAYEDVREGRAGFAALVELALRVLLEISWAFFMRNAAVLDASWRRGPRDRMDSEPSGITTLVNAASIVGWPKPEPMPPVVIYM